MNDEMKLELKERLLETYSARVVNKKQIAVRCAFCGDSKKHKDSSHMYIKIDIDDSSDPILFHCFICGIGGVLTPQILKEYDIRDLTLSSQLISYNNSSVKKINKLNGFKDNQIVVKVPFYKQESESIKLKKEYIENRLGLDLTFDELYELKTVFNIKDLLHLNKLIPTADNDKISLINLDYVGFLSCRNEFVICRNIIDNDNKRYDKYSLFKSLDNTRQFYSIPNTIDLLTTESIEINMAEGVFDILGIYYHIHKKNKVNKIFVANCGSGFFNVLKYFIRIGVFGNNVTVNIYSDSDKTENFYKPLINKLIAPYIYNFNLFYNAIGKDFGVRENQINIIRKRI